MSDEKIWAALAKNLGTDAMFRADDPMISTRKVINFPSYALGDATNYWGVPFGLITQLHGAEGSGKTFLALLMAAEAQKQYPGSHVFWIDAEFNFNSKWAKKVGVDLERIHVLRENDAAKAFTALSGDTNDKGKVIKPGVIDLVESGHLNVSLVVLDSIANLVPPVEAGRKLSDQNISPLARFLPTAFRRVSAAISKVDTAMICINQAREKIGERIPTLTYTGGRMYRHSLSLAIRITDSKAKDGRLEDASGKKYGHKVNALVEKTRNGANNHKASFWLDFNKGVVKTGEELALLGKAYGIIDHKDGSRSWEYNGHKESSKDAFFNWIESNDSVADEILAKIKSAKEDGFEKVALEDESTEDLLGVKFESFGDGEDDEGDE